MKIDIAQLIQIFSIILGLYVTTERIIGKLLFGKGSFQEKMISEDLRAYRTLMQSGIDEQSKKLDKIIEILSNRGY